jgi:hypothetical protein
MIKNKSLMLLACMSLIGSSIRADSCCSQVTSCLSNENSCGSSGNNCISNQYIPRQISTDLTYIDAITFYERYRARDNGLDSRDENVVRSIFTSTFLYQSSNKSKQLGSSFLLGDDNFITVAQTAPADVNSLWLGLYNPTTPFSSTFAIKPQSKIFGYHLNWYVNLDEWFCGICGLWFDLTTAILNTRHKLNCCEVGNAASQCSNITTVASALNNPNYQYGKFFCGNCDDELRRTAIDDVQFRLGYEWSLCNGDNFMGLYLIGTAPAGRKVTAENIFEPLIGSHHGSIGVGADGGYEFNICNHNFTVLTDFNYRYVLRHNECRTFDLCANGQFSRFLLVSSQNDPATPLAGVNFFTQDVKVTPGSTVQWWLALNYEWCNWNFEAGYNLFWRQQEKISLDNCDTFGQTIGIYNLGCISGCTTSSTATIGTFNPVSDATFVPLTLADLNLSSGAAGKVLTNKFYGAVATRGYVCPCVDWLASLAASYEFANGNSRCSALNYWAVFGKFSLIF